MQSTLARLNATLLGGGLEYTPDAGYGGDDYLMVLLRDEGNTGSGGGRAGFRFAHIVVANRPALTLPVGQHTLLNRTLVFNAANNNRLSVADPTAGSEDLVEVTIAAEHALLSLGHTSGIEMLGGTMSSGGPTISMRGTLSALNNALDGFMYLPNRGYSGPDTLTITAVNPALPLGAQSSTRVLPLAVDRINTPPSVQISQRRQRFDVDTPVAIEGISIVDADAGDSPLIVRAFSSGGSLTVSQTVPGGLRTGQVVSLGDDLTVLIGSQAEINATLASPGSVTFTPSEGFDGFSWLGIDASDQGASGAGGQSYTLQLIGMEGPAANRAPTIAAPGLQEINEDGALEFSLANNTLITVSDTSLPDGAITVGVWAERGTVSVGSNVPPEVTVSPEGGVATANLILEGPVAAVNAVLASLQFQSEAGYVGEAGIRIGATDMGTPSPDEDILNLIATFVPIRIYEVALPQELVFARPGVPGSVTLKADDLPDTIRDASVSHEYYFDAEVDETLSVWVTPIGVASGLAPVIWLYGPSGQLLESVSAAAGSTARIDDFPLPALGRYTVEIGGNQSTGSYRLSAVRNAAVSHFHSADATSSVVLSDATISFGGATARYSAIGQAEAVRKLGNWNASNGTLITSWGMIEAFSDSGDEIPGDSQERHRVRIHTNAANHGLVEGDHVVIRGLFGFTSSDTYSGEYTVAAIGPGTFDLNVPFDPTAYFELGTWQFVPRVNTTYGAVQAASVVDGTGTRKLALVGHVSQDGGVDLVDVTDPTQPEFAGNFRHAGPVQEVEAIFAVPESTGGIMPSFTRVTTSAPHGLSDGQTVRLLREEGSGPYVGEFRIFNVTPSAFDIPILYDDAPTGTYQWQNLSGNTILPIAVDGNRAFLGSQDGGGIFVVDFGDQGTPEAPLEVGRIHPSVAGHATAFETIFDLRIAGDYLFVTGGSESTESENVKVIVYNKDSLALVAEIDCGEIGVLAGLRVEGDRLYVSSLLSLVDPANPNLGWSGFTRIIDITNLYTTGAAPTLARLDTGLFSSFAAPTPDGDHLIVTHLVLDAQAGQSVPHVTIWDISDLNEPFVAASLSAADYGLSAAAAGVPLIVEEPGVGLRLYVSWFQAGILVFDIDDPSAPELVADWGELPPELDAGLLTGMFGLGSQQSSTLLATDFNNGLFLLDTSPDVQTYTLDLSGQAGQRLDIVLRSLDGADLAGATLELIPPASDSIIASSTVSGLAAGNFQLSILGFEVPSSVPVSPGVDSLFRLRMTSSRSGRYNLLVTKQLVVLPQVGTLPMRSLDEVDGALGHLNYSADHFTITLQPGQSLIATTQTPLDAISDALPGSARNRLNPRLELRALTEGTVGELLASDSDSAAGDDHNAQLIFTRADSSAGPRTFVLVVAAEDDVSEQPTSGDYVVRLNRTGLDGPTTSGIPDLHLIAPAASGGVYLPVYFEDPVYGDNLTYTVSTAAGNVNSGTQVAAGTLTIFYGLSQVTAADTFTVRATNPAGLFVEDTFHVYLTAPFDAELVAQPIGAVGQTLLFRVGIRADQLDDLPLAPNPNEAYTYEINWGDGTAPEFRIRDARPFTIEHAYASPGSFQVSVQATNAFGRESQLGTATTFVSDNSRVLTGTLRDFRADPQATGAHPDFQFDPVVLPEFPLVLADLVQPHPAEPAVPVFAGVNGQPELWGGIHSAVEFSEWFRDSLVNQSVEYPLIFAETAPGSGEFELSASHFFPLDNKLFGNESEPFNQHFTLAARGQFVAQPGQYIAYSSDDDLWIFIDGQLAIDNGGVHATTKRTFTLNGLSLDSGTVHTIDVFYADRHTPSAELHFRTNIEFLDNPGQNDAPAIRVPGSQVIDTADTIQFSGEQRITITDSDAGAADVKVTVSTTAGVVSLSQTTGLAFQSGTGYADTVMTFTATLANANAALNDLIYVASSMAGVETLTITVDDLGNAGYGGPRVRSATVNIAVGHVNFAPVITAPSTPITTRVDRPVNVTGIRASDLDAFDAPIVVTIGVSSGTLQVRDNVIHGVSSHNVAHNNSGSVTLTGSIASINATLSAFGGVRYLPQSGFTGLDELTIVADDLGNTGDGGAKTGTRSRLITVRSARNEAPVVLVPEQQWIGVDEQLVFSGEKRFVISDVDAGRAPIQVTIGVTTGSIVIGGTNVGSEVTLSGDIPFLNGRLEGLAYVPPQGFEGSTTLTVTANDLGNVGEGGSLSTISRVSIDVRHQNAAPAIQRSPDIQYVSFDESLVYEHDRSIVVSDSDAGDRTIQVRLQVTNLMGIVTNDGHLSLSRRTGLVFSAGDGVDDYEVAFTGALSDVNAALDGLRFTPRREIDESGQTIGYFTGSTWIQVRVDDLGNSGFGGRKTAQAALPIVVQAPTTVPNVNLGPVIALPYVADPLTGERDYTQTTAVLMPVVMSVAQGTAIVIADPDARPTDRLRMTLDIPLGTFTLNVAAGLEYLQGTAGAQNSQAVVEGTLNALNTALDGLTISPPSGVAGNSWLNISVSDLGNFGAGGARSNSARLPIEVTPNSNTLSLGPIPTPVLLEESEQLVLSGGNGNGITVRALPVELPAFSDLFFEELVAIRLTATHGAITLLQRNADIVFREVVVGGATLQPDGVEDSAILLWGRLAAVQSALSDVIYRTDAGYQGQALVTVELSNVTLPQDPDTSEYEWLKYGIEATAQDQIDGSAPTDFPLTIVKAGVPHVYDVTIGTVLSRRIVEVDCDVNSPPTIEAPLDTNPTHTFDVLAYNDAPLVFGTSQNNAINIHDPDAGEADISVTLSVDHGTLRPQASERPQRRLAYSGSVAEVNALLNDLEFIAPIGFVGTSTLSIQVDDLGNTGRGLARSASVGLRILVTASPNQAPTLVLPAGLETLQNVSLVIGHAENPFAIQDQDLGTSSMRVALRVSHGAVSLAGTMGLALHSGTGTGDSFVDFEGSLANVNGAIEGVVFQPEPGFVGQALIDISSDDLGSGTTVPRVSKGLIPITVQRPNQAPVISLPSSGLSTFKNKALTFGSIYQNAITLDDDDGDGQVLQLTLTTDNGMLALPASKSRSVLTQTSEQVVLAGLIEELNAALDGLTFTPDADFVGIATTELRVDDLVNNGPGVRGIAIEQLSITIVDLNSAPVLSMPSSQSVGGQSSVTFSAAAGNAIVVQDADAGTAPLEIRISSAGGVLSLSNFTGVELLTGDGADDFMIVARGSQFALNDMLDGLSFALRTGEVSGTITVGVDDLGNSGAGGARRTAGVIAISKHLRIAVPVSQETDEDVERQFSGTEGNQILIVDESATSSTILQVTLEADGGSLRLASASNLTFLSGTGAVSAPISPELAMTFRGTLAHSNNALNGLRFVPQPGFVGTARLRIRASQVQAVTGNALELATGTVDVVIRPINHAPSISGPSVQSTDQDVPIVFSPGRHNEIIVSDSNAGNDTLTVTLASSHGEFALGTINALAFTPPENTSGSTITAMGSLQDINAALSGLTFTPSLHYSGAAQIEITVHDNGSGLGGPLATSKTIAIEVAGGNYSPRIDVPGPQILAGTVANDILNTIPGRLSFSPETGNAIVIADSTLPVTESVIVTVSAGTGTLRTNGGAWFPELALSGSLATVNAELATLIYESAPLPFNQDRLEDELEIIVHVGAHSLNGTSPAEIVPAQTTKAKVPLVAVRVPTFTVSALSSVAWYDAANASHTVDDYFQATGQITFYGQFADGSTHAEWSKRSRANYTVEFDHDKVVGVGATWTKESTTIVDGTPDPADGVADGFAATDYDGSFRYIPRNLLFDTTTTVTKADETTADGKMVDTFTLNEIRSANYRFNARLVVTDDVTGLSYRSEWKAANPVSTFRPTDAPASIAAFGLAGDDVKAVGVPAALQQPPDQYLETADPTVVGSITGPGEVAGVEVELFLRTQSDYHFPTPRPALLDNTLYGVSSRILVGRAISNAAGEFRAPLNVSAFVDTPVWIYARTVIKHPNGTFVHSDASELRVKFTSASPPTGPAIRDLTLATPIPAGSDIQPGLPATFTPSIHGVVVDEAAAGNVIVIAQIKEGTTYRDVGTSVSDASGYFGFALPSETPPGDIEIRFGALPSGATELVPGAQQPRWSSFQFRLVGIAGAPVVQNLHLLHPGGTGSQGSAGAFGGSVVYEENGSTSSPPSEFLLTGQPVEVDLNHDDLADATVIAAPDVSFVVDSLALSAGHHRVRARASGYDTIRNTRVFGAWSGEFEFDIALPVDEELRVRELELVSSPNGNNAVTDATVRGAIGASLSIAYQTVEFDTDGNFDSVEASVFTDASGRFQFTPLRLLAGGNQISARAVTEHGPAPTVGPWSTIEFIYEPVSETAEVSAFALVSSVGMAPTSNPRFVGRAENPVGASNPGTVRNVRIEIGLASDAQLSDVESLGVTTTDAQGAFAFVPPFSTSGTYRPVARTIKAIYSADQELWTDQAGQWMQLDNGEATEVVYQPLTAPPEVSLRLANDNGSSSSDLITTDPLLTGAVDAVDVRGVTSVEFGYTVAGPVVASVPVTAQGAFHFRPSLSPGPGHTVYARAVFDDGESLPLRGVWTSLTFELLESPSGQYSFVDYSLKNDTGESQVDFVTADPTVVGHVAVTHVHETANIEFDVARGGVFDGQVDGATALRMPVATGQGTFEWTPHGLDSGLMSVRMRVRSWNSQTRSWTAGSWQGPLSFTLEASEESLPSINQFTLHNVGPEHPTSGLPTTALSDSVVSGIVSRIGATNAFVEVRFEVETSPGTWQSAGVTHTDAAGRFRDRPSGVDSAGDYRIRSRAVATNQVDGSETIGPWSDAIAFTVVIDSAAPPSPYDGTDRLEDNAFNSLRLADAGLMSAATTGISLFNTTVFPGVATEDDAVLTHHGSSGALFGHSPPDADHASTFDVRSSDSPRILTTASIVGRASDISLPTAPLSQPIVVGPTTVVSSNAGTSLAGSAFTQNNSTTVSYSLQVGATSGAGASSMSPPTGGVALGFVIDVDILNSFDYSESGQTTTLGGTHEWSLSQSGIYHYHYHEEGTYVVDALGKIIGVTSTFTITEESGYEYSYSDVSDLQSTSSSSGAGGNASSTSESLVAVSGGGSHDYNATVLGAFSEDVDGYTIVGSYVNIQESGEAHFTLDEDGASSTSTTGPGYSSASSSAFKGHVDGQYVLVDSQATGSFLVSVNRVIPESHYQIDLALAQAETSQVHFTLDESGSYERSTPSSTSESTYWSTGFGSIEGRLTQEGTYSEADFEIDLDLNYDVQESGRSSAAGGATNSSSSQSGNPGSWFSSTSHASSDEGTTSSSTVYVGKGSLHVHDGLAIREGNGQLNQQIDETAANKNQSASSSSSPNHNRETMSSGDSSYVSQRLLESFSEYLHSNTAYFVAGSAQTDSKSFVTFSADTSGSSSYTSPTSANGDEYDAHASGLASLLSKSHVMFEQDGYDFKAQASSASKGKNHVDSDSTSSGYSNNKWGKESYRNEKFNASRTDVVDSTYDTDSISRRANSHFESKGSASATQNTTGTYNSDSSLDYANIRDDGFGDFGSSTRLQSGESTSYLEDKHKFDIDDHVAKRNGTRLSDTFSSGESTADGTYAFYYVERDGNGAFTDAGESMTKSKEESSYAYTADSSVSAGDYLVSTKSSGKNKGWEKGNYAADGGITHYESENKGESKDSSEDKGAYTRDGADYLREGDVDASQFSKSESKVDTDGDFATFDETGTFKNKSSTKITADVSGKYHYTYENTSSSKVGDFKSVDTRVDELEGKSKAHYVRNLSGAERVGDRETEWSAKIETETKQDGEYDTGEDTKITNFDTFTKTKRSTKSKDDGNEEKGSFSSNSWSYTEYDSKVDTSVDDTTTNIGTEAWGAGIKTVTGTRTRNTDTKTDETSKGTTWWWSNWNDSNRNLWGEATTKEYKNSFTHDESKETYANNPGESTTYGTGKSDTGSIRTFENNYSTDDSADSKLTSFSEVKTGKVDETVNADSNGTADYYIRTGEDAAYKSDTTAQTATVTDRKSSQSRTYKSVEKASDDTWLRITDQKSSGKVVYYSTVDDKRKVSVDGTKYTTTDDVQVVVTDDRDTSSWDGHSIAVDTPSEDWTSIGGTTRTNETKLKFHSDGKLTNGVADAGHKLKSSEDVTYKEEVENYKTRSTATEGGKDTYRQTIVNTRNDKVDIEFGPDGPGNPTSGSRTHVATNNDDIVSDSSGWKDRWIDINGFDAVLGKESVVSHTERHTTRREELTTKAVGGGGQAGDFKINEHYRSQYSKSVVVDPESFLEWLSGGALNLDYSTSSSLEWKKNATGTFTLGKSDDGTYDYYSYDKTPDGKVTIDDPGPAPFPPHRAYSISSGVTTPDVLLPNHLSFILPRGAGPGDLGLPLEAAVAEETEESAETKSYWEQTLEHLVSGSCAEDTTAVGYAATVAANFVPYLGTAMDVRDLACDIVNFEFTWSHMIGTAGDLVAVGLDFWSRGANAGRWLKTAGKAANETLSAVFKNSPDAIKGVSNSAQLAASSVDDVASLGAKSIQPEGNIAVVQAPSAYVPLPVLQAQCFVAGTPVWIEGPVVGGGGEMAAAGSTSMAEDGWLPERPILVLAGAALILSASRMAKNERRRADQGRSLANELFGQQRRRHRRKSVTHGPDQPNCMNDDVTLALPDELSNLADVPADSAQHTPWDDPDEDWLGSEFVGEDAQLDNDHLSAVTRRADGPAHPPSVRQPARRLGRSSAASLPNETSNRRHLQPGFGPSGIKKVKATHRQARALAEAAAPADRVAGESKRAISSPDRSRHYRRRRTLLGALISLMGLLGCLLVWKGVIGDAPGADGVFRPTTAAAAAAPLLVSPPGNPTLAVETVQVGQRVPAWNPELNAAEHDQPDPDAATWRKLTLRMAKADGGRLDISLLRPLKWIDQTGAYPGQVIYLDLPELGAQGDAEVLALAPCPEIRPGQGRVVTGTFAHEVAENVLDVVLADLQTGQERDRLGATGVHPFWSETRQAFVPAAELTVGEEVLAITGDRLRVVSLLPRPGPERVYNLEVDGEHVYYVGALGVCVHNSYLRSSLNAAGSYGTRPSDVAHHIVAQNAAAAADARRVLAGYGIDVHSHWNGVFIDPQFHRRLHTNSYYKSVNDRIVQAGAVSRASVLRELQRLRSELLSGGT